MNVVVYIVLGASLFSFCICKNCVTVDRCKCEFDDNSGTIDLWATARTDGYPLFYDEISIQDAFLYSYNPCVGFSEGSCSGTSVCQFDPTFFGYYDIGTEDSASFSFDGLNPVATYTSADGTRQTFVTFVCDPSATTPRIDTLGESNPLNYYMVMTSSAACPVSGSSSGGGISAGSVLIIVLFALLVVYLIAGVAFNKIKAGATGKDLIPNKQLWTSIPGLIKINTRGGASSVDLRIHNRREKYDPAISHTVGGSTYFYGATVSASAVCCSLLSGALYGDVRLKEAPKS